MSAFANVHIVFFDLGHTLLYFDADWPQVFLQAQESLWEALVQAGLHLERAAFLRRLRLRLEAYYRQREVEFIEHTTTRVLTALLAEEGYPRLPDRLVQQALERMYATTQAHWQADPQAHATLRGLRARGYALGLISNAAHDADVQALVERHGLRPYFEVILTSAAAGIRKPEARIFAAALSHWGCPPSHALMVGDTPGADILGAHNAGMEAIWLRRYADTARNRAEAEALAPEACIADLGALLALLRAPARHPPP